MIDFIFPYCVSYPDRTGGAKMKLEIAGKAPISHQDPSRVSKQ